MKHGMSVIKTLAKFLSLSVISLFLPSQKLFSGTGMKCSRCHAGMLGGGGGGLQIEMMLWTMCGDLLALSDWTTALTEAGIASIRFLP